MNSEKPLVVDLDGSFIRTDTLHELLAVALRHPARLWRATKALTTSGKAAMKLELAAGAEHLRAAPVNVAVLALAQRRASEGAAIVLATGADRAAAEAATSGTIRFDEILASDGVTNLTSDQKAIALVQRFGEREFDYVGNSRADRAVWLRADHSYLATLRRQGTPKWARNIAFEAILRDPSPPSWRVWSRAVRVHQSLKNLLVFLPLLAAHELTEGRSLLAAAGAFVAFTLMASGVYLLNDTLDLPSDRAHHRKRNRPLAAGVISPLLAVGMAGVLTLASLSMALLIGPAFLVVLAIYAMTTTSYSLGLKRIALVDIVVLAILYMIRIVAGAVATGIALSFWFTAVTLFLFLSLALVKRYAEAHDARTTTGDIPGRGYSGDDVHAILALGTATGVAAVLLAAIYIQSDAVRIIYPAPEALWFVIPTLFYWMANLWLKAGRGQMHDDPLVFALRDRASLAAAGVVVLAVVAASLPASATILHLWTSP